MIQVQISAQAKGLLTRIGRLAAERGIHAYAVGGCVRDWLLGCTSTADVDVTVEGSGLELARRVAHKMRGALTEHRQFGTATISPRPAAPSPQRRLPLRIDIATCRKETYARPAAYPKVRRGTLRDDLFRRDFTINAMALAITPSAFGRLVDPFGGARDLRQRRLRILHDRSFQDDPSRLLRGVRFAQRFGLRWERGTRRAALEAVAEGLLGQLNAGRVARELEKMCDEPDPRACLEQVAALLEQAQHPVWSS